MKAIILAAGMGTRLGKLTSDRPKVMTDLGRGVTILDKLIEGLFSTGIDSLVVVTGYRQEVIAAHVEHRYGDAKIQLVSNEHYMDRGPFYSLYLGWLSLGDEDFLVLNGDTLLMPEFYASLRALIEGGQGECCLFGSRVENYSPDDVKVDVADGRIRRVGKRIETASGYRSSGLFLCKGGDATNSFRRIIREYASDVKFLARTATWHGFLDAVVAPQMGIRFHEVSAAAWQEVDTCEDVALAASLLHSAK